jgi:hypothetical protein
MLEIQMVAEELLPDLHCLFQCGVQVSASLSGSSIQVDAERPFALVEDISDEARDEDLIHFLLDLSRAHGLTLLASLCGFHHVVIRQLTEAVRRLDAEILTGLAIDLVGSFSLCGVLRSLTIDFRCRKNIIEMLVHAIQRTKMSKYGALVVKQAFRIADKSM